MFSVTKTGMNFRPLCTANVYPTRVGVMVERRDQVFMIFLSPVSTALVNFRARPSSTYGPFLMDRPTSKPLFLYFPRRLTMSLSVDGFLRVLYPFVGFPHGVQGCRPPEDRPSPPPCGWSPGVMTTPRTVGGAHFPSQRTGRSGRPSRP